MKALVCAPGVLAVVFGIAIIALPAHADEESGSGWDGRGEGGTVEVARETTVVPEVQYPAPVSGGSVSVVPQVGVPVVSYVDPSVPVWASSSCTPADAVEVVTVSCRPVVAASSAPSESPAAVAAAAVAPQPLVVTSRDVAQVVAGGSGITRQPPGPEVLVTQPFIVYTSSEARILTATIGGTSVEILLTPTRYTWSWGDGTSTATTDPGAPYPDQTVSHTYAETATGVTTTLATVWDAQFRPAGELGWRPVAGSVTTTESTDAYDVVRTITYLTDDAEQSEGH